MGKFLAGLVFLAGLFTLPFSWPVGLGLLAIGLVLLLNIWQGKSSAAGRDPANDPNYTPEKIAAPQQPASQSESRPEGQPAEAAPASGPPEQQRAVQVEHDDASARRIEAQQRHREALESQSRRSATLNFWKWLLIISGAVMLFVSWPVGLGLLLVSFFVAGARWTLHEKMAVSASAYLMEALKEAAENARNNGLEPATANQVWRIGRLARETDTWEIDTRSDALGRPLLCIERAGDIIEELQIEKLHQEEAELWG
ncbi:MAG: hypothetical protein ISN29_11755 [Gammaproteobacteria bacterium AqS3]|nr:hypothetical protein [Gammaproteobacteria bacterium AqS3]